MVHSRQFQRPACPHVGRESKTGTNTHRMWDHVMRITAGAALLGLAGGLIDPDFMLLQSANHYSTATNSKQKKAAVTCLNWSATPCNISDQHVVGKRPNVTTARNASSCAVCRSQYRIGIVPAQDTDQSQL